MDSSLTLGFVWKKPSMSLSPVRTCALLPMLDSHCPPNTGQWPLVSFCPPLPLYSRPPTGPEKANTSCTEPVGPDTGLLHDPWLWFFIMLYKLEETLQGRGWNQVVPCSDNPLSALCSPISPCCWVPAGKPKCSLWLGRASPSLPCSPASVRPK